jgi:hypothetical protein
VPRFDRRAPDGKILHPYASCKEGDTWTFRLYLPLGKDCSETPERDFIALAVATANDVRAGADGRHNG